MQNGTGRSLIGNGLVKWRGAAVVCSHTCCTKICSLLQYTLSMCRFNARNKPDQTGLPGRAWPGQSLALGASTSLTSSDCKPGPFHRFCLQEHLLRQMLLLQFLCADSWYLYNLHGLPIRQQHWGRDRGITEARKASLCTI
eukprot:scaffold60548_cov16-Tisochrysis_lutea.AAC.1